jgi:beta-N-acetylhexosaminidase
MATLTEKVAQMFLVGVSGSTISGEEKSIIEGYPFGGFILFNHNCCAPAQILGLCRDLWCAAGNHPPVIAIDQEGGRVHRLPEPFTHYPAAACIGKQNKVELAYEAGKATAEELALVGINLNFAPVLDVHSNPRNPIIGDRAFAANPADVVRFSGPWIKGLRDGGIIPCGKHFPGHGDTDKDSHLDLPVVHRSLAELRKIELSPFRCACSNGIEALMTAHVLYSALDPLLPATLSHKIVTGLLRQELSYDGVVFSDDMEMKAITSHTSDEEAISLGVAAGIDVMLYCHELPRAVGAFEFLRALAERDEAVRTQVENSYRRITNLKRRYLKTFTGVEDAELNRQLARSNHRRIADAIQPGFRR